MILYELLLNNQVELISLSLIAMMMAISPGADFAVVTKNSVSESRKAGIYTAFGITIGIWVHISYCIAGLAVLIHTSELIFSVVKYIGAVYLISIGIKSLITKSHLKDVEYSTMSMKPITAMTSGFISNVLNPKTTLFFLGIFSQFVTKDTPISLQLIYGSIISIAHLMWFATLSYLLTNKNLLPKTKQYLGVINKTLGIILIILGAKLVFL